jgi:hypothetical protein
LVSFPEFADKSDGARIGTREIICVSEQPVREISEAETTLGPRNLFVIHKHIESQTWMKLVEEKLVPLRLLIPARPGTHEWSKAYRNLIFEMALFVHMQGGEVTPDLARQFAGRTRKPELLEGFSESEVVLLMRKSVEYDLPIDRPPGHERVRQQRALMR